MVHLEDTEKLGEKGSRSVASIWALTISSWARRSVEPVVDVVTPMSGVSPALRRGMNFIYVEVNGTEIIYDDRKGNLPITRRLSARKSWLAMDGNPA